METINWFEIVNTGGTIAVLVLNVWMFATGKVISSFTFDRMMKSADDRTIKLAEEIKQGIKDAVKDGIVSGIHEVRKVQEA